jgi:endonuclease-8
MEGGVIEAARIRDRQFECEHILGRTVTKVEPRGKHLLMHCDPPPSKGGVRGGIPDTSSSPTNGVQCSSDCPSPTSSRQPRATLIIHSHMGMTGSWHVYHPGQPWLKPTHYAALVLSINRLEVICFSPRLLELLTADQLRRHPHIQRLGPDLLGVEFDMHEAIARFRTHNHMPLGEAVINQTIVSGIGNEYKSDLMFLFGLNPLDPVARYTDDELIKLLEKARFLMRRNLTGALRRTRLGNEGGRLWVYGMVGKACPKCGTPIKLQRQGDAGRTTFWCPKCQPARQPHCG